MIGFGLIRQHLCHLPNDPAKWPPGHPLCHPPLLAQHTGQGVASTSKGARCLTAGKQHMTITGLPIPRSSIYRWTSSGSAIRLAAHRSAR